jgi:hypothetical protein
MTATQENKMPAEINLCVDCWDSRGLDVADHECEDATCDCPCLLTVYEHEFRTNGRPAQPSIDTT